MSGSKRMTGFASSSEQLRRFETKFGHLHDDD
jgi:hypothetical protein